MTIRPGTDIAGYRVNRILGNGGTGIVCLAHSAEVDMPVALKLVNRDFSADPVFRMRFVNAARLVRGVEHPNVVPTLDLGETVDGHLWMTMPFVQGASLEGADADRQLRAGRMSPERALRVVARIADALDHVHGRGIVHGDVKPANFLIGRRVSGRRVSGRDVSGRGVSGRRVSGGGVGGTDAEPVLLADFSLARRCGDRDPLGTTGMVLVSAAYAAPEALRGEALDGCADVYSLGCSLFRLLTGKPPFFDAGSKAATVHSHLHSSPPSAVRFAPWLPDQIDDVIATAMGKDRASRYPSAGSLAAAALAAFG